MKFPIGNGVNKNLKSLNVTNNKLVLQDLSLFEKFEYLERLEIGNTSRDKKIYFNDINGSLKSIENYRNLKVLSFPNTRIFEGVEFLPKGIEKVIFSDGISRKWEHSTFSFKEIESPINERKNNSFNIKCLGLKSESVKIISPKNSSKVRVSFIKKDKSLDSLSLDGSHVINFSLSPHEENKNFTIDQKDTSESTIINSDSIKDVEFKYTKNDDFNLADTNERVLEFIEDSLGDNYFDLVSNFSIILLSTPILVYYLIKDLIKVNYKIDSIKKQERIFI